MIIIYINVTYNQEFDDLLMHLRSKYPKQLFDMDGIGEQLDLSKFSKKFFGAKATTADLSIDANANVDDATVISYSIELKKPFERINSYFMLWKELRKSYGTAFANEVVEMNLTGDIYIHDMHGIGAGQSYCWNYSTYDIMTKGLPMIKKIKSMPPRHLYSFKSQLEQFIVIAANSTLGATGLADLFIVMSYYVKNILETKSDAHFTFASEEDCWRYIKETITSFVYTVNQPMRANQSPYTNVSVFDDAFIENLKDDYLFPDGSYPDLEIVKELQRVYIDIMNEELERTPATFPVTSACFSVDEDFNVNDIEFKKMIAQKSTKFGFMNFYTGKTTTLSSCCFAGGEQIVHANRATQMQEIISLRNLYEKELEAVWVEKKPGVYAKGKVIRIPAKGHSMYKIETESGQIINATEDHLWPMICYENDVRTDGLVVGDKLIRYLPDGKFYGEEITKIDKVAYNEEWVYCIEMDNQSEPYFLLANGIRTHNCRLRSDITEMPGYMNSIGGGSTKVGSIGVVSLNLPRAAIQYNDDEAFCERVRYLTHVAARINSARRKLVQKRIENGNHPLYEMGFIELQKQYSTTGINGLNEALYFLGKDVLEDDGQQLVFRIMDTINSQNIKNDNHFKFLHNVEQVPLTYLNLGHYKPSLINWETPNAICMDNPQQAIAIAVCSCND